MADTSPGNPTPPTSQDSTWLEQYYTDSKTFEPTPGEQDDVSYTAARHVATTDKYRVTEELGAGGMKSVRRAYDINAARDVAMAVLREGKYRPHLIRRFVREARITAALEHPNIVPVHEIGVDPEGRPYFTMKLLGGESLHKILKQIEAQDDQYRKRYTLSRLLQIFLGTCNAVAFAHSRGVVHLDLKPANIQVGGFGEVLVLDWGLAKVMERIDGIELPDDLRAVHTEGVVRGTPGFMAPEQTRGEYSQFDERTDVYSLGAVLWTLLTNKFPSPGRPPEPSQDRRISPALRAVAWKAMALKPADRYQTVRELIRDVQAFLGGFATSAQQASVLTLLRLLIKRQKLAFGLVSISATLILTMGIVSFVRIARSEQATRQALRRIEQEREENRKLGVLAAPRVLQKAIDLLRVYDLDGAEQQLDFALALDSTVANGWFWKSLCQLGRQQFEEALLSWDRGNPKPPKRERVAPEKVRNFDEVALKFRLLKEPLTREQQLEFITEVHRLRVAGDQRACVLAFFFQRQNRQAVDPVLLTEAFKLFNPEAQKFSLESQSTADGLQVTLRGEKLSQLHPLIGLPIASLDLSDAVVPDLAIVRAINSLVELRVVNWPRENFPRLRGLNQVARIVVSHSNTAALERELRERPQALQVVGE